MTESQPAAAWDPKAAFAAFDDWWMNEARPNGAPYEQIYEWARFAWLAYSKQQSEQPLTDWARLGELLGRMQAEEPDFSLYHGPLMIWRCFWGSYCGRGETPLEAAEAAWTEYEARQPADADGRAP